MENGHLLMGKLTISMAIFNSYVKLPEGTLLSTWPWRSDREIPMIFWKTPWELRWIFAAMELSTGKPVS